MKALFVRVAPRRVAVTAIAAAAAAVAAGSVMPGSAGAAGSAPHPRPIIALHSGQSSNWFGYNQGIIEKGKPFQQVAGDWTVPTAKQRVRGQAEDSATWVGIGGGCLDTNCTVTDQTLIQAGTSQDVASNGAASYFAWWELIPAPSLTITGLTVRPGDHMHVDIRQLAPGVWTITLRDITRNETFTQTVPYSSTMATAEWIAETPTIISSSGTSLATLPTLSTVRFDLAQADNAPANLNTAERIFLVNSSNRVIGAPSAPDSDRDGFNACANAATCSAPAGS